MEKCKTYWNLEKITSLILFAVVPDHSECLTDHLVPDEQWQCNGQYF